MARHVAGSPLAALAQCPSQLGISAPVPSLLATELAVVILAQGQAESLLLTQWFFMNQGFSPHLFVSMVEGNLLWPSS